MCTSEEESLNVLLRADCTYSRMLPNLLMKIRINEAFENNADIIGQNRSILGMLHNVFM